MIADRKIFSINDIRLALNKTYTNTVLGSLFPSTELENLSKIVLSYCFQELDKEIYKGNEIIPVERMKKEYECLINN